MKEDSPSVDPHTSQEYIAKLEKKISEQDRNTDSLSSNEERFRILVELIPHGIEEIDATGRIVFANGPYHRILGYEDGELIGKSIYDIVATGEEGTELQEYIRYLLENQPPPVPYLGQQRTRSAKIIDVQVDWDYKRDASGKVVGFISVITNITERRRAEEALQRANEELERWVTKRTRDLQREIAERKQAEEALRKSEQQYRSAIEVAGAVPYYQYYENHSFQFIGTGIQSLLGYSAEEFTMELWDDLEQEVVLLGGLVGLTLDEAVIKARNEEGVSWRADYRMRTRDGEERWIANAAVQVRDEKGNVIGSLGILQDLTERKQLEEHLRQSQKMEAVGQLAGGIAHDFNNLLTGILGNLNLAMRDAPDRILEYIQTAIDAANRAGHLVQQLLAFGRKSRVELKPVDLNRIVDEVYRLVRKVIDRRIDILVQTQEDLPTIEADAPQMNSVLMNLCINARDAINEVMYGDSCPTRQGDRFIIEIRTHSVFLSSEEAARYDSALPGPYAVLSVSDNGIGMSEQTQQHLFEPFFTTKDLGKGTGLGLAGTYGIVRQHNGRIRLESIPGKGTSISILLPAMESVLVDTEKEYQTELRGGKETILLVDDEEIIRDLGRTVLEELGYTVVLAEDGRQALDIFSATPGRFDLIVLDLSMPNLSGREVLEYLRVLSPDIKVLVSSGYSDTGQGDTLERFHPVGFIPKPYRPSELSIAVREALDTPCESPAQ